VKLGGLEIMQTSEKPWGISSIALTASGISKKEVTFGIKLSVYRVCVGFFLVMPWLKIYT